LLGTQNFLLKLSLSFPPPPPKKKKHNTWPEMPTREKHSNILQTFVNGDHKKF
jgi:hypothetical protein